MLAGLDFVCWYFRTYVFFISQHVYILNAKQISKLIIIKQKEKCIEKMQPQNQISNAQLLILSTVSNDITSLKIKEQKNQIHETLENKEPEMEEEPVSKDTKTKQNNRWLVQWSEEEDDILFQKYIQLGSKWSELSQYLPMKSDNAIKNRFYCCMRKVQRKMNKVQKQKKIKHRKLVKYQSLLTFLEIGKTNAFFCDKRLSNANKNVDQIVQVRDLIISIAKQPEKEIDDREIETLLHRFLELKYSLKFINIQRVKNNSKKVVSQIQRQSTFDQTHDLEDECKTGLQEKEKEVTNIGNGGYLEMVKGEQKEHDQGKKLSLMEECHDILIPNDKKQEFDYLFFL